MNSVGIIKWIRIKIKRSEQRENIIGRREQRDYPNGKEGRYGEVAYECVKKRNSSYKITV